MNVVKYLFALWAGIMIYALLTISFGAMGFSAQRQLENDRKKQETNVENLKNIHRNLEQNMNSALYDRDTLAVYAREQGYASAGERFIRIVGLGVSRENNSGAGSVISAVSPQYVPDETLRIIALCAGISVFVCMAVWDFLKRLKER